MNDDPKYLKLGDGTLIDTNTGKRVLSTEINNAFAVGKQGTKVGAASYDGGKRRYLDDLPCPAPQSKAIAIIASYFIFGLAPADIAHIMSTELANVTGVMESKDFQTFLDGMLQNLREHDTNKVRKQINDTALQAAKKISSLTGSFDEKVALAASKDVLDRVERDVDRASGRNNGERGSLTIRIIKDAEAKVEVDVDLDG